MKKYFYTITLIVVFWCGGDSNAQSQKVIDSLEKLLYTRTDTSRITILKLLCWENRDTDPLKGYKYGLEALEMAENAHLTKQTADILNRLGVLKRNLGDYSVALDYYFKSLSVTEKSEVSFEMAASFNNISDIYNRLELFPQSLEYGFKALNTFIKIKNKLGTAYSYNQIGLIYKNQKKYDEALKYFKESLSIRKLINHANGIATSLINIADTYMLLKNYEEAYATYLKSLEENTKIDSKAGIAMCYNGLGEYNFIMKKNDIAISYFNKAAEISKQIASPVYMKTAFHGIRNCYAAMNDYRKAYQYQELYSDIKDSLTKTEFVSKITQFELLFKMSERQKFMKIEKEHNEVLRHEELLRQRLYVNFLLIGFLFALIFAGYAYYNFHRKRKANKLLSRQKIEILEKNEELHQQKEEIVTQAELLEQTNRELEQLSIVASCTDNAVIIVSADGEIEWVNPAFTKIMGYTLDEFSENVGNNLIAVGSLNDIDEQNESVVYTRQAKTKTGNEIWLQTTLTPVFDSDGKLSKLVAIDTDITKLKEVEHKLSIQNQDITDSIHYARRIQIALLPTEEWMNRLFRDYFIFNRPRNIVSGDFYWVVNKHCKVVFAVGDCTGHGVPGAFMSILGIAFLKEITNRLQELNSSIILTQLTIRVERALHQTGKEGEAHDGMDIALCILDKKDMTLQYSGANRPLVLINHIGNEEDYVRIIKPDKIPIGSYRHNRQAFTCNKLEVKPEDTIYLYTDGYTDQLGGEKRKKFYSRRLVELLAHLNKHSMPMLKEREILEEAFLEWKGDIEQTDDVLVMGVRI